MPTRVIWVTLLFTFLVSKCENVVWKFSFFFLSFSTWEQSQNSFPMGEEKNESKICVLIKEKSSKIFSISELKCVMQIINTVGHMAHSHYRKKISHWR